MFQKTINMRKKIPLHVFIKRSSEPYNKKYVAKSKSNPWREESLDTGQYSPPQDSILSNLNWFVPIWSGLIWFDPIWSNWSYLIHFDLMSSNLIQFDPTWSTFIWFKPNNQSDPTCFDLIQFEPTWTNLIQIDPTWSDLIQFYLIYTK